MTTAQLASLEAVARKAAEQASQSLSKLIGIPVKLEMTRTRMVEVAQLASLLASPEESVSAVMLPVAGEGIGSSVLVSSLEESLRLAELLTKQPKGSLIKLDDPTISVLKETANIIGGAFLSVLSNTTGISLIQSVPSHRTDTLKTIVDAAVMKLHQEDGNLSVAFEIDFALSATTTKTIPTLRPLASEVGTPTESVGATEEITTNYIFLLNVAFAQKLLAALGKQ